MAYESRTTRPALKELFDRFMPNLFQYIDVPPDLQAALNDPDVKVVFNGELNLKNYLKNASQEEQTRRAIIAMNAFRLLLEQYIAQGGDVKDLPMSLKQVSDNVFRFIYSIDAGSAWVALRNAYGPEYANRKKGEANTSHLCRFAVKHWMPLFHKIHGTYFKQAA